jgi:hypothetical protein
MPFTTLVYFNYIRKLDPGDRVRRTPKAPSETRVRRLPRKTGK